MTETDNVVVHDDTKLAMLRNVMDATGLPEETVASLLMTDDDLDALCDAVLSELANPLKRLARTAAER